MNDLMQKHLYSLTCFCRNLEYLFVCDSEKAANVIFRLLYLGIRHIYFIYNGNNHKILFKGFIGMSNCLCLNSLRGINKENNTFNTRLMFVLPHKKNQHVQECRSNLEYMSHIAFLQVRV